MCALLLTGVIAPPAAAARPAEPAHLDQFLWGLGQQESGGEYAARNPVSGAYGKYQIMPFNWPTWARLYAGDSRTKQTPSNQETVARGKVTALYHWLGSYREVAHWWLTGSSDPDRSHWSAMARRYVDNVLSLMDRAPSGGATPPDEQPTPPATGPGDHGGSPPASRVTTGWLNFRAAPGVASRRIGPAIRPGTRLVVLTTQTVAGGRTWLRVRLPNHRVGWVSARYTRTA